MGKNFIAVIQSKLEGWLKEAEDPESKSPYSSDKKSIADILNKLDHMQDKYGNILSLEAKDAIDNLEVGKANILDLGSVDEFASDVVVSHILRNVLRSRKERCV